MHMLDVLQGYRSLKDKTIHRPHPSWAADENHSAFGFADWSLVSGWNSSSYIMLQRDSQQEGMQDSHHGNMLMVCIQNKVRGNLSFSSNQMQTAAWAVGVALSVL